MTSEDLPRIQKLIDESPDEDVKAAGKEAILAILHGPARAEARKDAAERRLDQAEQREETRFQVGMAGLVVGGVVGVGLLAAGIITLPQAAVGTVGLGVLKFAMNLVGKRSDEGKGG